MNKVILIGNLTRDPELATTPSGVSVCRFGIAVNRSYKNASGERDADFFNIVTWRKLAEICGEFLAKGRKVAISGSIETRTFEDKDGIKKNFTDIVADDVVFLTPKGEGGGNYSGGGYSGENRFSDNKSDRYESKGDSVSDLKPVDNDDLPF
ncbi:MAG: single-stranded DNA-binding protein [Firmicutes bacterium]|jgi:single-strand DNA-binding protein|nr:single-stranded DNA-binding protein [Bacillota bacterium]